MSKRMTFNSSQRTYTTPGGNGDTLNKTETGTLSIGTETGTLSIGTERKRGHSPLRVGTVLARRFAERKTETGTLSIGTETGTLSFEGGYCVSTTIRRAKSGARMGRRDAESRSHASVWQCEQVFSRLERERLDSSIGCASNKAAENGMAAYQERLGRA